MKNSVKSVSLRAAKGFNRGKQKNTGVFNSKNLNFRLDFFFSITKTNSYIRRRKMVESRSPVIAIKEKNCINCHKCISVCPVKFCIDGSGDKVSIRHDLCIGCGHCIEACDHGARSFLDDYDKFRNDAAKGERFVAIVAPAIAASFPENWPRLLGYLQETFSIEAFFDVSLGAELTVKSYLDHLEKNQPKTIISQPCPAIVSYIEQYQPELIPYLAPADSPMLHILKVIQKYFTQYKDYKTVVISPCLAKRREFDDTGHGDYNVTIRNLQEWIEKENINLAQYQEANFIGPDAERAVRFSTPGGLMLTADRDAPGIAYKTRKIEGISVYDYLKDLPEAIEKGYAPLLIDCLNCENGCNGGPGTKHQKSSHDLLAHRVENRFKTKSSNMKNKTNKSIEKKIAGYWESSLYKRTYIDRSQEGLMKAPNDEDLKQIYKDMRKSSEEDFLNCTACGYNSCDKMAVAIHKELNKKENCHLYLHKIIKEEKDHVSDMYTKLHVKIENCRKDIEKMNVAVDQVTQSTSDQSANIVESSAAIEEMVRALDMLTRTSQIRYESLNGLDQSVRTGEKDMEQTVHSIDDINQAVNGIGSLISIISEVAEQTSLLSMNAAIQAAHAGDSGRGFSVVASEIRKLAISTDSSVKNVTTLIDSITNKVGFTQELSGRTGKNITLILGEMHTLSDALGEFVNHTQEMSLGNKQVNTALCELKDSSSDVMKASQYMTESINILENRLLEILDLSDQNMKTIQYLSGA
jgi:iron only hydrogenase large subunit-like protein